MPTPNVNTPDSGKKAWQSIFRFTAMLALIIGVFNIVSPASAQAYSPASPPPKCSAVPEVGQVFVEADGATSSQRIYSLVENSKLGTAGDNVKEEILSALSNNPTWIAGLVSPSGNNPLTDYQLIVRIWDVGSVVSSATEGVSYGYWSDGENNNRFIRHEGDHAYKQLAVRFYRNQGFQESWVFKPYTGYPYGIVGTSLEDWQNPKNSTVANSLARIIYKGNTGELADNLDCIIGASNIYRYPKPYAQELPAGGLAEAEEKGGNLWDSITGGISDMIGLIKKIPEMLVSLVIPDETTITSITTDFGDFFSEKFGFLVWPFEYIADFLGVLTGIGISDRYDDFGNPYNWCSLEGNYTNGTITFGNFMGGSMVMNGCAFQKIMPTIWTLLTIIARGLLVFAIINFLLATHRRHVK